MTADARCDAAAREDGETVAWPARMAALVPVYNHADTVGEVVEALRALGAPVLAVDDGSTDGSGAAAEAAGASLIRHPYNRGKAAALLTGLHACARQGYTQALTIDADGQHPIAMAQAVVATADRHPDAIVIGVRDMTRAPWRSRWGRACSNAGAWLVSGGRRFGDTQSGLRVYPLPATVDLPVAARRYAYEIEVLVRAAWREIPIRRTPVTVHYPERRVSHFRTVVDTARGLAALMRLATMRCLPGWRTRHAG